MKVIGIDPAIATCGFALLEHDDAGSRVLDMGAWECKAGVGLQHRLEELRGDVVACLLEWRPDVVIAELPIFMRQGMASAMLWSSFATIGALCHGRAEFVGISTKEWRTRLCLQREVADMPKMPKHPRLSKASPCACGECVAAKKLRAKAQREAKQRRKDGSAFVALARFPTAQNLLDASTPSRFHEHALEALCIAASWTERAPTPRQVAQANLFNP